MQCQMRAAEGTIGVDVDGELRRLQLELLDTVLLRIDAFCRALFVQEKKFASGTGGPLNSLRPKDSSRKTSGHRGDSGKVGEDGDILLCAALCDLARYARGEVETATKTATDALGTPPPSRERLRDILQHLCAGKNDSRVFFNCCANLIAEIVGLSPCVRRRYPRSDSRQSESADSSESTNKNQEEPTLGSVEVSVEAVAAAARSALELPSIAAIKVVQHQLGRFPYGLLTIAVARSISRTRTGGSLGQNHLEYQGTMSSMDAEMFVPAVLVVSPFYVSPSQRIKGFQQEMESWARHESTSKIRHTLGLSFSGVQANTHASSREGDVLPLVPFPTTFWLSDPLLRREISRLEKSGSIKDLEETLLTGNILRTVIEDNVRFIALRWMLVPKGLLSHFYSASEELSLRVRSPDITSAQSTARIAEILGSGLTSEVPVECNISRGFRPLGDPRDLSSLRGCEPESTYVRRLCTCSLCKLVHSLRVRGIGGIAEFTHVRCLHMQYALHLLVPTAVGNAIDKLLHDCRSL